MTITKSDNPPNDIHSVMFCKLSTFLPLHTLASGAVEGGVTGGLLALLWELKELEESDDTAVQ
ncbi:hypothetical protein M378DRAFT_162246 [Amanita muscaria Koide BX008]|uniref:Uncharacterized protein n=1 Tax=Amanita muscaria (strain Koide BX008) TaxID=946122 RepID=A0A0C2X955_AMAMK|nr:hypothetical protein M378DRAFT_162246 [Amanita muscaria Koide BX008]